RRVVVLMAVAVVVVPRVVAMAVAVRAAGDLVAGETAEHRTADDAAGVAMRDRATDETAGHAADHGSTNVIVTAAGVRARRNRYTEGKRRDRGSAEDLVQHFQLRLLAPRMGTAVKMLKTIKCSGTHGTGRAPHETRPILAAMMNVWERASERCF